MDFMAQKQNGRLAFTPPVQEAMRRCIASIQDGKYVKTSIVVPRKGKSYAQCQLIFGHMLQSTIIQAEDKCIGIEDILVHLISAGIPKGQKITKDYLHQLMYIIAPTFDTNGNQITLSKMDTEQAASLFERYCNIMAGLGIVIETEDEILRQFNKE